MNEKWEEQASLYVLDQLDARERSSFEAQLRADSELAAYVRELQTSVGAAVRALPPATVPDALLAAIEAKIEAAPARAERGLSRWQVFRWAFFGGLAAVVVAALGGFAVWRWRAPVVSPTVLVAGLTPQRSAVRELPLPGELGTPEARFIGLATLAEQYWDDPAKLPLASAGATNEESGYAVYDPQSRQGFVAIRRIPTAAAQQRYHLWVYDRNSGHVRDAGILPLASGTRGLFFFAVNDPALSHDGALNFFITVESGDEHRTAPAGKVVLGARPL